jgi:hypothetical protein
VNIEKKPGTAAETNETSISIDREGNWFYQGQQIVNRQIYLLFSQSLERDASGRYILRIGEETCPIAVEDTPFVVTDIAHVSQGEPLTNSFSIRLNDETEEVLNLDTLYVGKDNVLYCAVKEGNFRARFLRPSYYRLAEHIVQDAEDRFYIPLNGKNYYIKSSTCP